MEKESLGEAPLLLGLHGGVIEEFAQHGSMVVIGTWNS